ncbi:hypothetical protein CBS101457_001886 [Exobasidium rhododendri]|nr:hypothetical protein CBS101457_001886 [Exobasidium rhododendri]
MASLVASSSSDTIEPHSSFQISHRGQRYDVVVESSMTLGSFQNEIAELTKVDATHQKLLLSGPLRNALSKCKENEDKTLQDLKLLSEDVSKPFKVMLVGPTNDELSSVQRGDLEAEKRNRPRQYHPSMLRGGKPRNTNKATSGSPFHALKVHPISPPASPEYALVLSRLQQLSTDAAVLHVCHLHSFQIGEFTELLPHEHPNLLGLNENMGQRISVRLRTTNHYDGLIPYRDTRSVLLHELAHNKVNDHPPEFKILNSELNAQVEAYERRAKAGTNYLSDMDFYVPAEGSGVGQDGVAELSHSNVLGGSQGDVEGGDLQSRRQKVLMATMKRLEKSEAEIEKGCGSAA